MSSVNKLIGSLFFIFFILNCSLDKKSGIWTQIEDIKVVEPSDIKELFKDEEASKDEVNSNVRIQVNSSPLANSFINNLDNNNNRIKYNGNLQNISKYKFSSIKNFNQIEPEIVFDKTNVIFFDDKGSVLSFNSNSKLNWEKNFYEKKEKKSKPILSLASNEKYLIIIDNLANYYALDIKTGNHLWSYRNSNPFNSQIKIFKDKFFAVDFENILRCFSLKNGEELWNVKTENAFIKSQKKLSVVILGDKVYFNNSIGDISAVDINTGNLIWQTPTQSSAIYEDAFFLKTSDIVIYENSLLFSNNRNEFFSLNANTGTLNWSQKINSNLRPTIIDNLIFTVTQEGLLVILENNSGEIIRVTNIFDKIKKKKRSKIHPVGFIVGTKNIYLTTDNGLLILIDILSGRTLSVLKIDNNKISRPFFHNNNLFIVKNDAIIKLN